MRSVIKSFKYAATGLWYILKSERNARVHLVVAMLVFTYCKVRGVSDAELAAIYFAIVIVFLAEIVNTALEKTLDLIEKDHNPKVKLIKDMAAGAVLVAAVGAVIGAAILWPYVLNDLGWL
jgi:diacylglycerol kinase (ATP)